MDNIWYDAEMYNGRGYKDPDGYNTTEYHSGPENKRECPCDTCPLFEQCLADVTECSAMRNWCSKGDYKDKDVQRLLRAAQAVDILLRLWQYNRVSDSAYPQKLRDNL